MEEAKHFIAGAWAPPAGGETIAVIDPSDGEPFARLARGTAPDVGAAVQAARAAFDGSWGALGAADRGRMLYRLSMLVAACREELALIESRDTGKPLTQARADADALARYLEFYAGAADKLHGETLPYRDGYTVLTLREPHGVTGHIVPWNYPMQILGRGAASARRSPRATRASSSPRRTRACRSCASPRSPPKPGCPRARSTS
ncbi:aldehyde dehydrogenase family protein [Burkholderia pseudomallei]|nr:aldehyde dehydrogenase family protein [Burkholderia pseudomallei]